MAQKIKNANIFGRIGSSIGKGLAEQIPQEVMRNRTNAGLQQLETDSPNLNAQQYYTRALQVPGLLDHPQAIQSLAEIANRQSQRDAYRHKGNTNKVNQENSGRLQSEGNALNIPSNNFQNIGRLESQGNAPSDKNIPSNFPNHEEEAKYNSPKNIQNPLSSKFQPAKPWTQERILDTAGRYMENDRNLTFDAANKLAKEEESREMAMPESERAIKQYNEESRNKLDDEFDTHIEEYLQKKGPDIYGDLTGETLKNLKKAAFEDLSTNPELNERSAAEKWAKKGKFLSETKSELRTLSNRDSADKFFPGKKQEALKRLKAAEKIFAETGNRNEFFDILRGKNIPPTFDEKGDLKSRGTFGFDLSPGAAALISNPRSESIKKIIRSNEKWGSNSIKDSLAKSRKLAEESFKNMNPEDSILAIAQQAKMTNPQFNEIAFFDYFRENIDRLPPQRKKELTIGISDFLPRWGDIALFPYFEKSVVND